MGFQYVILDHIGILRHDAGVTYIGSFGLDIHYAGAVSKYSDIDKSIGSILHRQGYGEANSSASRASRESPAWHLIIFRLRRAFL